VSATTSYDLSTYLTFPRHGSRVTGAPSKVTSYVVLGTGAGPKKLETIAKHNLKTVDEDGFLQLIASRSGGEMDEKTKAKKEKEEEAMRKAAVEMEKREREQEAQEKRKAKVLGKTGTAVKSVFYPSPPGYCQLTFRPQSCTTCLLSALDHEVRADKPQRNLRKQGQRGTTRNLARILAPDVQGWIQEAWKGRYGHLPSYSHQRSAGDRKNDGGTSSCETQGIRCG
jgi:hypothetical protein